MATVIGNDVIIRMDDLTLENSYFVREYGPYIAHQLGIDHYRNGLGKSILQKIRSLVVGQEDMVEGWAMLLADAISDRDLERATKWFRALAETLVFNIIANDRNIYFEVPTGVDAKKVSKLLAPHMIGLAHLYIERYDDPGRTLYYSQMVSIIQHCCTYYHASEGLLNKATRALTDLSFFYKMRHV